MTSVPTSATNVLPVTAPAPPGVVQPEPSSPLRRRFRRFSRISAGLVIACGAAGLAGCIFGNRIQQFLSPGHVNMKANTAVCLMVAGAALWLAQEKKTFCRRIGQVATGIVLLLPILTGLEYLLGADFGIDQLLVRDYFAVGLLYPGRMAASTVCALLLSGFALAASLWHGGLGRLGRSCALAGLVVTWLVLLGYSYGVPALYFLGASVQMAFSTTVALTFLCIGTLSVEPEEGFMALLTSEGSGGAMLRRVLPVAILLPWVLGLFGLTMMGPTPDHRTPQVIVTMLLMATLGVVLYLSAHSLEREESERRAAEQALRRSRDQWETTFNCMGEGLTYHDPEFNILGANQTFQNLLGEENLTGRKCYEVVHGLDHPIENCPMERTLSTGKSEASEIFEPRLNRYLAVRTDPVLDREGKVVSVVHVVRDITGRKKAEEEVRRLAAIVENSDDAIIGKNMTGSITDWNQGAERIYGYKEGEALGMHISQLSPPEVKDEWLNILARISEGEFLEDVEREHVRKDGSRIQVSITISPIRTPEGEITGVSTIARNITEKVQARRQIEQLNAELEERVRQRTSELEAAVKELEAFSYSVSHDLRAPLRRVDGFSHVLLSEYGNRLDEQGRDFLHRVRSGTQQMSQLIDALLQLSRVSRSEMSREQVDLTAVSRTITEELRHGVPDRAVDFSVGEGISACGDARLLHILMRNLLENAWKFTSTRPVAHIEFGAKWEGSRRVYFVRDNGVGFPMGYGYKLFQPFQRLHGATEFEGHGVGLATVQRIVRRHGGQVWAEGKPDHGATFYFTLPPAS